MKGDGGWAVPTIVESIDARQVAAATDRGRRRLICAKRRRRRG